MDRIIVKTLADMQRVIDWAEELRGMAVELPFSEGEIVFEEELVRLKFRDEQNGIVSFELYVGGTDTKVADWRSNLNTGEMPELHIAGEGQKKMALGMILTGDDTIGKCVRKFRALMLFAAYYREEVIRSKTVERKNVGTGKKGKRSNRRPLTVRKYTISSEMLSELPAPKKEWHGYRESFGVRGHYRRYKSGKVVWVRPYVKKGVADKKSDREYVL